MLTNILIVLTTSLILLLAALRSTFSRSARRATAYVCDICNEQDCVCRLKR
jgi:hypothetical protein